MNINTVSILGLGYIGLPTAAMFASKGFKVQGIDINPDVVNLVNEGKILKTEFTADVGLGIIFPIADLPRA